MRPIPLLVAVVSLVGCAVTQNGSDGGGSLPPLDFKEFACKAQRPMVRRCSMLGCHGEVDHALRIYSPGKLRHFPWTTLNERNGPITMNELQANFQSALGLTYGASSVDAVPILFKTVAPELGGGEHVGGVIFRATSDPDFIAMRDWLSGATWTAPDCPLLNSPMEP